MRVRVDAATAFAVAHGHSAAASILFPGPDEAVVDACLLVRLGNRVPAARRAREQLRRDLARAFGVVLGPDRPRHALTTMPERFGPRQEHTVVGFVRELAAELDIECINDRFVEVRPRPDVTGLDRARREQALEDAWRCDARLDGRIVILLDDVIDSGSSLRIAAAVLARAGASVVPVALVRLADEEAETERVVHKYFGRRCAELLGIPEVQGSLRRSIERWSQDRGWLESCRA